MNVLWLVAGILGWAAAATHAIGGEIILKGVTSDGMPSSRFGGPRTSRKLIWVSWHITSLAFAGLATVLIVCGVIGVTPSSMGAARAAAATFSVFAAPIFLGTVTRGPRALLGHPAPIGLTVIAALAWLGTV